MDIKAVFYDAPADYIPPKSVAATWANNNFSNVDLLKNTYTAPFRVSSLGKNAWKLDGKHTVLGENQKVPYISKIASSDTYDETEKGYTLGGIGIVITKEFQTAQSIKGITLITDPDIYITHAEVNYCKGTSVIKTVDVYPDKYSYYQEVNISGCDKIQVWIMAINKPNNYLVLFDLLEAAVYEYTNDCISECLILEEKNIINTSLPSDLLELEIKTAQTPTFTEKQQISVFVGNKKKGVFYIDSVERQNRNTYRVIAYDLISCLDNYRYLGEFVEGYPFDTAEDKVTPTLGLLLDDIFKDTPYEYTAPEIELSLDKTNSRDNDSVVEGYNTNQTKSGRTYILNGGTCRTALLNVLIGCNLQYEITDDNRFVFSKWQKKQAVEIPAENTFINGSVKADSPVSDFSLNVNFYTILTNWFERGTSGVNDWKERKSYDYLTYDGEWHTYVSSRFACWRNHERNMIPTNGEYDFKHPGWFKYKFPTDETFAVAICDLSNIPKIYTREVSVTNGNSEPVAIKCDFVNNPTELMNHIENYYKDNRYFEGNIIIPENLKCGDTLKIPTEWQGDFEGVVEQIEYSLKGGQKLIGKVRLHAYG